MNTRPDLMAFEGEWTFTRHITHEDAPPAQVTGRAVLSTDGAGLRYDETGLLRLNDGPPMTATRRYLWRPGGVVLFDDGRDFHTIPEQADEALHFCDPDTYRVRYDFANWPNWTSTWSVSGPKKAYIMVTAYQPV